MKVYLIRHGRSVDAEQNLSQGLDSGLSDRGRKEVLELKKEVYDLIKFDKVYHSALPRAAMTAKLLFGERNVDLELLDFLHEYERPSRLYGVAHEVVQDYWEENRDNKYKNDWKPEDGESFNEIVKRADSLMGKISEDRKHGIVGVVGHGIFFKHLVGRWLLKENYRPAIFFDMIWRFQIGNGEYTLLDIDGNGEVRVEKWSSRVL